MAVTPPSERPASGPASSTPPRRPSSVRRTTTHDSLRTEGLLGPVTVVARGRDLRTGPGGETAVVAAAELDVTVEPRERTVTRITAFPPDSRLERLVGVRTSSGFRRAAMEAMPGEERSRSVRFQLLDDLPTALLVSGYAVHTAGVIPRAPGKREIKIQQADVCAGWAVGGTLLASLDADGLPPSREGPPAPAVERTDDAVAWHEMDRLPAQAMRRRRRIDVWSEDGGQQVESWFRDSHMGTDDVERIVHEYSVRATVDPETRQFVSCEAGVGSLPWPECPQATASAHRLVGAPVDGLRRWVRQSFVGPTTCTHLNDTLRALEDVGALLSAC
jgi:hypothetical protein